MIETELDLTGCRILLVEDDTIIALDLEATLQDAGCAVVGPLATVPDALAALAASSLDGAVLDVNLGRESAYPIADALADRGLPFVFVTGYSRDILPDRHNARTIVTKPFQPEQLLYALVDAIRQPD